MRQELPHRRQRCFLVGELLLFMFKMVERANKGTQLTTMGEGLWKNRIGYKRMKTF